mmetsp:Transcript_67543/g.211253  ORF Transcript_67543/g.211253 Transcript_67543/m.211253 type:complete len:298 (+) Transcript_67543:429-1322(+)
MSGAQALPAIREMAASCRRANSRPTAHLGQSCGPLKRAHAEMYACMVPRKSDRLPGRTGARAAKLPRDVLAHEPRTPALLRPHRNVLPAPPHLLPEPQHAVKEVLRHLGLRVDAARATGPDDRGKWADGGEAEARCSCINWPRWSCRRHGLRRRSRTVCGRRLQRRRPAGGRGPALRELSLLHRGRLQQGVLRIGLPTPGEQGPLRVGLRAAGERGAAQEGAPGLPEQLAVPRCGLPRGRLQRLASSARTQRFERAAEHRVYVPAANPDVPVQAPLARKPAPRHPFECRVGHGRQAP